MDAALQDGSAAKDGASPAEHLLAVLSAHPLQCTTALALVLAVYFMRGRPAELQKAGGRGPGARAEETDAVFFRSFGPPDEPHDEFVFLHSLQAERIHFGNGEVQEYENEHCTCRFLSLHRATWDSELSRSGDYRYGSYFVGKKRLWEQRYQLRFKKPPSKNVFFGIQLEEYVPMGSGTKRTMETLVSVLKRAVGTQIYHSPGDNPELVTGELELPLFAMPLWAFDQYIVTPEGVKPPALNDPGLSAMGSSRYRRVKEFKKEMNELEFNVGSTYTFCFWGISQWLDRLNWQVKMPLGGTIDFDTFCGRPPVHCCIYALKTLKGQEHEKRHLQSRMIIYSELAFWSSKRRPSAERAQELLEPGDGRVAEGPPGLLGAPGAPGVLSKRAPGRAGWLACCTKRVE